MLFMSACLLSFINLSNFSEKLTSLPSSIVFFFLKKVRISPFNFLTMPCLSFVAVLRSLCSSSFNFYLNQSLVLLVVIVTCPQAENADNVAFHFNFWSNCAKSLSETMFDKGQFLRSFLIDCDRLYIYHLATILLVLMSSLMLMCSS